MGDVNSVVKEYLVCGSKVAQKYKALVNVVYWFRGKERGDWESPVVGLIPELAERGDEIC